LYEFVDVALSALTLTSKALLHRRDAQVRFRIVGPTQAKDFQPEQLKKILAHAASSTLLLARSNHSSYFSVCYRIE
jgi:hypothetical protein